ncbi:MAG: hypothetical protein RL701_3779 [Pseudomonadota bacterium]|jgi:hypothetical protein
MRAEIIDGAIVTQPAPLPEHSEAAGELRVELAPLHGDGRGGGPGGWWILLDVAVQISVHTSGAS